MINKQRVRRIKNLIYAFMILLLLLPAILMFVLGRQILDTNREIIKLLDSAQTPLSQNSAPLSAPENTQDTPGGGYVIDPDGTSISDSDGSLTDNPPAGESTGLSDNGADSSDTEAAGGGAPLSGVTQIAGGASEIPEGSLSNNKSPGTLVNDSNISGSSGGDSGSDTDDINPDTGIGVNNNPKTGR
ncbi:MAG: hypothetical protein FWG94_10150 [Oscillospiraceae bacterium]|nr:hypothetical protein [Oscillospiraceae bacterium]